VPTPPHGTCRKKTTATHCADAGGVGIIHVTVHFPFPEMTAAGETSQSPERLSITKTEALAGWPLTVPVHTYRRPGGGGWDCSDRPVMARCTAEAVSPGTSGEGLPDEGLTRERLTVGAAVPVPPGDPLGRTLISATTMLATAATTEASSICHRSRRRACLFRGRVPMITVCHHSAHQGRCREWRGYWCGQQQGQAAPRRAALLVPGGCCRLWTWPWRAAAQSVHRTRRRRP
jgi:hypothetical protein